MFPMMLLTYADVYGLNLLVMERAVYTSQWHQQIQIVYVGRPAASDQPLQIRAFSTD